MADDDAAPEPSGELAVWFGFLTEVGIVHQLSRALFEARLPGGVTLAHFTVLNHLVRVRDGQTPLALAEAFQVPKATMTHTLTGLEARGLVAIRPNPEDGRSKRVWLTEAGRRFRAEAIGLIAADVEALARQVPTGDVARALPVLEAVRRVLDASRP